MNTGASMRLDNLNSVQMQICDELWNCETMNDINNYIGSLDTETQYMAWTLVECMMHEEHELSHRMQDHTQARDMLNNIGVKC